MSVLIWIQQLNTLIVFGKKSQQVKVAGILDVPGSVG